MKRRVIFGIGIAAVAAISIYGSAGGSQLRSAAQPEAPASDGHYDFTTARPRDRIDRYLGQNLAPSHWTELDGEVEATMRSCMEERGVRIPRRARAVADPAAELRGNDLAAFHRSYGYGVVALQELQQRTYAEAKSSPVDEFIDDEVAVAAFLACEDRGARLVEEALPPTELHRRYQSLIAEYAKDEVLQAAMALWNDCMEAAGLTGADSPVSARVIVELAVVDAVQETALDLGMEIGDGIVLERVVLPAEELQSLQAFERKVFAADTACLEESGSGALLMDAESRLLAQLKAEYPSFAGFDQ